ncbi:hypothetical protein C8Q76DRAFT_765484 [Earliella scabrosa]|nr:hypothetical protein C8Q76DRAFT_765484 [Earliella scabrosa]
MRQREPPESLPQLRALPSEDDAVFFTFIPRRRRVEVDNSFLSLDLTESQSMRSMSLRRKDTITTRATTHFGRSAPGSPVAAAVSPPLPFAFFSELGLVALPRKSLVRRSSREGHPGAKPAPSSQLPAVPHRRPRPADLGRTFSNPSSSQHRSLHSEPAVLSPISPLLSPIERSYVAFSPPTSPPAHRSSYSPSQELPRSAPAVTGNAPSNFMRMSDDEDDFDLDEMIAFPPTSISAPAPNAVKPGLLDIPHGDIVVPSSAPWKRLSSTPSSKRSRSRSRNRRGTFESLLSPLTNFIDFREDDRSSRSWRSFVEIS